MRKYLFIVIVLVSCSTGGTTPSVVEVIDQLEDLLSELEEDVIIEEGDDDALQEEEENKEEASEEEVEPTSTPTELPPVIVTPDEPEEETVLVKLPDNCSNPPKDINPNGGFKCKGSETRNETIVCVLPYQFTWKPYKEKNDGRNVFRVNKNDKSFDKVNLVLKNNSKISLKYAGNHNPVFLNGYKQGRQHWRDESRKWHDVKNRVKRIEMFLGNQKTCLGF